MSATIRARVNGRAGVAQESLSVQVTKYANRLAGAEAHVKIIAEPDFDLGTLLGEVFRDDNGNGQRDRGEPGSGPRPSPWTTGCKRSPTTKGAITCRRCARRSRHQGRQVHPATRREAHDRRTRIINVTPGLVLKVDFGVRVPEPDPARPQLAGSTVLPELKPADHGVRIRLTGVTLRGAKLLICPTPARTPCTGRVPPSRPANRPRWTGRSGAREVRIGQGRNRFALVTELPDGRVTVAVRDVFWVERRRRQPDRAATRRDPADLALSSGALAEPTFRLEGTVTAPLDELRVAGQPLRPDAKGRVAVRIKVPEAGAGIGVDVRFSDGLTARFDHALTASGDFVLLVGLAEGKLGYVQRDGAAGNSGLYADGRVKLYAKGRIQGRWLLEGALDIDSSQLDSWRDLFRGNPQQIFRNLDPDCFYTVYGDSSQVTQAAQSRARLFVRIQLDRSELLFGNLETGLTGVEYGRYSRAVTGGRISFVRAGETPDAPPSTQVILFGAWLQTSRAHDELRGTGGSLYYLSHRNVVEGSEQVRMEMRDHISDRPMANTAQRATVDYEVDYLAGRLMMREPSRRSRAPRPWCARAASTAITPT